MRVGGPSGMSGPLRHRNFRLLFSGQVVSNLGDWLDYLALAVLIAYVWDKGPASLAALAIAIAAPWIVVAPIAGVLADRWPKRATLIGCDLARAAAVTGLIFAPSLGVVLALVVVATVFSTLFAPAEQATIRWTVPEDELHAANALSQLVTQSTKVVGPALGGVLVSVVSPRVAFGVDAVTFLCSAAILSRMATVAVSSEPEEGAEEELEAKATGFWQELREGIAYIAGRRALKVSIAVFAATVFLLLAFDSLSPLAFRELGVNRALFGIAIAAIGLGGVVGAIAVGRYGDRLNPFGQMGGASVVIGGMVALMGVALLAGLDVPPALWAPVLLIVGLASAGVLIASPTILQRETPPALMGRVSASAAALPVVCQLCAPIAGAAVARWQSVGFVFAVAGGALALLGAVVLIVRPAVGAAVPGVEAAVGDAGEVADTVSVDPSARGAAV